MCRGQAPALAITLTAIAAAALLCACKSSNNNGSATPPAAVTRQASAAATTQRTPSTAVPSITVVSRPGTPGQIVLSANGATPDTVTVQGGRSVTFVNNDSAAHHPVSVEAGLFDVGVIAPGGSAQVTVTAAGLHDWHDATNPRLSGTIRVVP